MDILYVVECFHVQSCVFSFFGKFSTFSTYVRAFKYTTDGMHIESCMPFRVSTVLVHRSTNDRLTRCDFIGFESETMVVDFRESLPFSAQVERHNAARATTAIAFAICQN